MWSRLWVTDTLRSLVAVAVAVAAAAVAVAAAAAAAPVVVAVLPGLLVRLARHPLQEAGQA